MIYLAIDPGNTCSGVVLYSARRHSIVEHARLENEEVSDWLDLHLGGAEDRNRVVIESIASYGMPVGKAVFETAEWSGIFASMCLRFVRKKDQIRRVYRKDAKLTLCNSFRAKDSNIRTALIDRFEPLGGGATPQIGTRKQPGPLYGFAKDQWSALAIAITAHERWESLVPFPLPDIGN